MNAITSFEYGASSVEAAQAIHDAGIRIKCRMERTAADIVEIGRDLIEVKRLLGHGHFQKWISTEFEMTSQTARNFMMVGEQFGGENKTILLLPPTILYALAAPSTSDEVRTEVLERVDRGESVTLAEVRELKQKLAEKDDKLRKVKGQKESADAHNGKLIDEVRSKSSEVVRLADQLSHLKEEVRRLSEPNTITVTPLAHAEAASAPVISPAATQADITPWMTMIETIWESAPAEARDWMRDYFRSQET